MTRARIPKPEFSRAVSIAQLGEEGLDLEVAATPAERGALAERFDLVALDALAARLRLAPVSVAGKAGRRVRLSGRLRAEVVQRCVVTLEPVHARIDEPIEIDFAPEDPRARAAAVAIEPEGADLPEPLVGDRIDVGEALAEQLALSLDPYPRRPGAVLDPGVLDGDADASGDSPFAVLEELDRDRRR